MQFVHGGDWAGYRAEFGRDPLDFSANVSPLGLPEGWPRPSPQPLPRRTATPILFCRALREKLAAHEGVPAEQLLCGNGAADLIFRLVWAKRPPQGAGHGPHLCGICRRTGNGRLHGGALFSAGGRRLRGDGGLLWRHR